MLKKIFLFLLSKMGRVYERLGVWVIPDHFYTPIPELKSIRKDVVWDSKISSVPGIDLNEKEQIRLLESEFPRYVNEYSYPLDRPARDRNSFYFNNGMFANTDAEVYYCMIRYFKPERVVEVGAGRSTQICCDALQRNREKAGIKAEAYIIEPYADKAIIEPLRKRLTRIIETKVQQVGFNFFQQLKENDFLFIDSSHIVKSGGDVNYLFLEIFPRLNPGVVVHIHDIRIPYEVSRKFILAQSRFFTEQYLLHAFLIGNDAFQILWGTYFMTRAYPQKIAKLFRSSNAGRYAGGSFWIKRKPVNLAQYA